MITRRPKNINRTNRIHFFILVPIKQISIYRQTDIHRDREADRQTYIHTDRNEGSSQYKVHFLTEQRHNLFQIVNSRSIKKKGHALLIQLRSFNSY